MTPMWCFKTMRIARDVPIRETDRACFFHLALVHVLAILASVSQHGPFHCCTNKHPIANARDHFSCTAIPGKLGKHDTICNKLPDFHPILLTARCCARFLNRPRKSARSQKQLPDYRARLANCPILGRRAYMHLLFF